MNTAPRLHSSGRKPVAATGIDSNQSCADDYTGVQVGRVYIARWHRTPTRQSLARLIDALAEARLPMVKPLIYCAYIGADAPMLAPESRRLLSELEPKMLEHCDAIHVVFDGASIMLKMLLTIRRTINILAPYRKQVSLHTSVQDFLTNVRGDADALAPALVNAFQQLTDGYA